MIKCLECGKEVNRIQWTHLRYKCTGRFTTCKQYILAYPDAKIADDSVVKKTAVTKDNMISKYGKNEGEKRWKDYCDKQAKSNSFEYKNKKHGWTKEQFDAFNSSRSITLKKCVERHGEIEGIKKWHDYCYKQAYTNTKEYFVEKYGIEIGTKKYLDYNKKKGNSSSPEYIANKLNITRDQAVEVILGRNDNHKILGSEIEKEFTSMLEDRLGKLEFTTFTKPYGLWAHSLNSYVIYDIKHGDCVIEFNGDYWHCNPKLYESTDVIRNKKTANEIWEKDRKKNQVVIDKGLRLLVVWESEFKKNKIETIERVIKWMQNGQK